MRFKEGLKKKLLRGMKEGARERLAGEGKEEEERRKEVGEGG